MGKPRRTRRAYNPANSVFVMAGNPVWKAFANKPVDALTQVRVAIPARGAYDEIILGRGTFSHVYELFLASSAGLALCEQGYGSDLEQDFRLARQAAVDMKSRYSQSHPVALSEAERLAILQMLDLHEQQVAMASKSEVASAIVKSYQAAEQVRFLSSYQVL